MKTQAYAAQGASDPLQPFTLQRRAARASDVQIDIEYCGVCHSDIHQARNEWASWGPTQYPCVPGHEIIGRVRAVGDAVTRFKPGERVAVGCLVDSCRRCACCEAGLEQYCENGFTATYNSQDGIGGTPHAITYGGYSQAITVDQDFVVRVPEGLDPAGAAPLLCAGITTYSPLKHWNVGPGQTVGVIGLGGLGHMGVKFAHALGAHVVMITTSPDKAQDAQALGADEVLISTDQAAMQNAAGRFDFLLNTIPVGHDINPYMWLLRVDGTMVLVGALEALKKANGEAFIFKRRSLAGSLIGGIRETQEMLDFCGQHNIVCDVETIDIKDINAAFDRTVAGDVKYRFVIDMATLKAVGQ